MMVDLYNIRESSISTPMTFDKTVILDARALDGDRSNSKHYSSSDSIPRVLLVFHRYTIVQQRLHGYSCDSVRTCVDVHGDTMMEAL